MRYKCGLSYPKGRFNDWRGSGHVGFAADTVEEIAEMCDRVANGLQCDGGAVSLTVMDRPTGSAVTIQRRSCHGFGEMVRRGLEAFSAPEVPAHLGQDALIQITCGRS